MQALHDESEETTDLTASAASSKMVSLRFPASATYVKKGAVWNQQEGDLKNEVEKFPQINVDVNLYPVIRWLVQTPTIVRWNNETDWNSSGHSLWFYCCSD